MEFERHIGNRIYIFYNQNVCDESIKYFNSHEISNNDFENWMEDNNIEFDYSLPDFF